MLIKFRPYFILDKQAFISAFPMAPLKGKPLLISLTIDRHTCLPVKSELKSTDNFNHEQIGSDFTMTADHLSCTAGLFFNPAKKDNEFAMVSLIPLDLVATRRPILAGDHLQDRIITPSPSINIHKKMFKKSNIKNGDVVVLRFDRLTQKITEIALTSSPFKETELLESSERELVIKAKVFNYKVILDFLWLE